MTSSGFVWPHRSGLTPLLQCSGAPLLKVITPGYVGYCPRTPYCRVQLLKQLMGESSFLPFFSFRYVVFTYPRLRHPDECADNGHSLTFAWSPITGPTW